MQHGLLRGSTFTALDRHPEAAAVFLQTLAVQPGERDAYMQLGFSFAALRRFAEAAECFRTVVLIEPTQFGAAVFAAHYAAWACDWRETAADHQRLTAALAHQADSGALQAFSPFCLLAMDDDVALHRRAARLEADRLVREVLARTPSAMGWGQSMLAGGTQAWPQAARALASGRCKVGLVSADFRTHAIGMLLVQTLENLDRSRFELTLYSHGADDSTLRRQRLVAAADHFVDCTHLTLAAQAGRTRDDGTVILIDMSGYTGSRLQLFALRPAPVQAVWRAYPGTLGAPWIDCLIGDPLITLRAHADDFDEKIVQLPLCYEPRDELPSTRRPSPAAVTWACPKTALCTPVSTRATRSPRRCSRAGVASCTACQAACCGC